MLAVYDRAAHGVADQCCEADEHVKCAHLDTDLLQSSCQFESRWVINQVINESVESENGAQEVGGLRVVLKKLWVCQCDCLF